MSVEDLENQMDAIPRLGAMGLGDVPGSNEKVEVLREIISKADQDEMPDLESLSSPLPDTVSQRDPWDPDATQKITPILDIGQNDPQVEQPLENPDIKRKIINKVDNAIETVGNIVRNPKAILATVVLVGALLSVAAWDKLGKSSQASLNEYVDSQGHHITIDADSHMTLEPIILPTTEAANWGAISPTASETPESPTSLPILTIPASPEGAVVTTEVEVHGNNIAAESSSINSIGASHQLSTSTGEASVEPSATSTATLSSTPIPTSTSTDMPEPSATPTQTLTAPATSTDIATSTETSTETNTATETPTDTATSVPTMTITPTNTQTPTLIAATITPTATPTITSVPTTIQGNNTQDEQRVGSNETIDIEGIANHRFRSGITRFVIPGNTSLNPSTENIEVDADELGVEFTSIWQVAQLAKNNGHPEINLQGIRGSLLQIEKSNPITFGLTDSELSTINELEIGGFDPVYSSQVSVIRRLEYISPFQTAHNLSSFLDNPDLGPFGNIFRSDATGHVSAELLAALAWHESKWRNLSSSNDGRGAGIFQETVRTLESDTGKPTIEQATDPEAATIWAVDYLQSLLDRYGNLTEAIAHWNGGINPPESSYRYARQVVYDAYWLAQINGDSNFCIWLLTNLETTSVSIKAGSYLTVADAVSPGD